jgi:hypothetical protein
MLQRLWPVDDLDAAADHEVVSPVPGTGSLPGGTPAAHPRGRSWLFVDVRAPVLIWQCHSSLFAIVRARRTCKPGVVGSRPIVSTLLRRADVAPPWLPAVAS